MEPAGWEVVLEPFDRLAPADGAALQADAAEVARFLDGGCLMRTSAR